MDSMKRRRAGARARRGRGRALLALAGAALAALALSACGSGNAKETSGTYAGIGGVGAPYLSVGGLVYQVQISRMLNPYDTEDSAYLEGLSAQQRKINPGEELFGVFVQVYNESSVPRQAAREIRLYDTEGNTYEPITPDQYNLYAYRPGNVPVKSQLPTPDSTAANGPINGLMLLYKIKTESLENRPLSLKIISPTNPAESASAELDS